MCPQEVKNVELARLLDLHVRVNILFLSKLNLITNTEKLNKLVNIDLHVLVDVKLREHVDNLLPCHISPHIHQTNVKFIYGEEARVVRVSLNELRTHVL